MSYLEQIPFSAIVQITILYLVIYAILKAAKGSRFGQALMGVGILAASLFAFTFVFHFDVLSLIIKGILAYLAISTVVIFQPEIRRMLAQVGAFGYLEKPKYNRKGLPTTEFIVDTLLALSGKRLGALVAFERGISLRGYEETGVRLDAAFSLELVTTIFTPPLPLHDGGVTIRDGRLSAAHCVFPVSNNPDLIVSGMRHRAAVGLSEETDALVIAVSEETGAISVAHNGRIIRYTGENARTPLIRWINKVRDHSERRSRRLANLLKGLRR